MKSELQQEQAQQKLLCLLTVLCAPHLWPGACLGIAAWQGKSALLLVAVRRFLLLGGLCAAPTAAQAQGHRKPGHAGQHQQQAQRGKGAIEPNHEVLAPRTMESQVFCRETCMRSQRVRLTGEAGAPLPGCSKRWNNSRGHPRIAGCRSGIRSGNRCG